MFSACPKVFCSAVVAVCLYCIFKSACFVLTCCVAHAKPSRTCCPCLVWCECGFSQRSIFCAFYETSAWGGGVRALFPPVHDEQIGSESVSSRRKNPTVDVELVPASSLHPLCTRSRRSLILPSPSSGGFPQLANYHSSDGPHKPLTGCTRSIGPAARVNSLMYPVHSVFYDDRRTGGPGVKSLAGDGSEDRRRGLFP